MKTSLGIWIDKEKAFIVTLNDSQGFKMIPSYIAEHYFEAKRVPHSERAGHTQIDLKEKVQRHEHEVIKNYLKKVLFEIKDASEIVIFGPSNMKHELQKLIEMDHNLAPKLKAVENADFMTHNQIVAWVKTFFRGSARYTKTAV